jgi:biopolymer transport protein ExbD
MFRGTARRIDVVFLLLIFFVLNTRFKTLEARLDTFLPKDRGHQGFVARELHQDIGVRLTSSESGTKVVVGGENLGELPPGWTRQNQDLPANRTRRMEVLDRAFVKVRALHQTDPQSAVVITVDPRVQNGDVVALVNECLRADVMKIAFAGAAAAPPGK